jgi:hypothetical protein
MRGQVKVHVWALFATALKHFGRVELKRRMDDGAKMAHDGPLFFALVFSALGANEATVFQDVAVFAESFDGLHCRVIGMVCQAVFDAIVHIIILPMATKDGADLVKHHVDGSRFLVRETELGSFVDLAKKGGLFAFCVLANIAYY